MEKEKKILIMGVGNTLLRDEGFGVRAVEKLRDEYEWPENVRLLDGATRGLLLLGDLMECDLAILMDTVLGGQKPGTCYLLRNEDLARSLSFKQSMHQNNLEDVLISCELVGKRPEVLLFGFEPFDCHSVGERLTPEAAAMLPEFCEKVLKKLKPLGIEPLKRLAGEREEQAPE